MTKYNNAPATNTNIVPNLPLNTMQNAPQNTSFVNSPELEYHTYMQKPVPIMQNLPNFTMKSNFNQPNSQLASSLQPVMPKGGSYGYEQLHAWEQNLHNQAQQTAPAFPPQNLQPNVQETVAPVSGRTSHSDLRRPLNPMDKAVPAGVTTHLQSSAERVRHKSPSRWQMDDSLYEDRKGEGAKYPKWWGDQSDQKKNTKSMIDTNVNQSLYTTFDPASLTQVQLQAPQEQR